MRMLLLSFGSRFTLLCLLAAVATTVGCGGGGGGGGGGATPTVSLGSVTLSGQVEFPGTVDVQVDGAPAVVSGTTWTFTTTQVAATHTYAVTMSEGGTMLAQRSVVVSR